MSDLIPKGYPIYDTVYGTDDEKNHHAKPHGDVEIQIADSFIQNEKFGDIHQKTTDDGVHQKDK